MTLQSIQAQSLRPAFKANDMPAAAETKNDETQSKSSTGKVVGWSLGAAAAIAATVLGINAIKKGKTEEVVEKVLEKVDFKKAESATGQLLKGLTKAEDTIKVWAGEGKQIISLTSKDGKLLKRTINTPKSIITKSFNEDGSTVEKIFSKVTGYTTTVTKAKNRTKTLQVSLKDKVIGSVTYKKGEILKKEGSIIPYFNEKGAMVFDLTPDVPVVTEDLLATLAKEAAAEAEALKTAEAAAKEAAAKVTETATAAVAAK